MKDKTKHKKTATNNQWSSCDASASAAYEEKIKKH